MIDGKGDRWTPPFQGRKALPALTDEMHLSNCKDLIGLTWFDHRQDVHHLENMVKQLFHGEKSAQKYYINVNGNTLRLPKCLVPYTMVYPNFDPWSRLTRLISFVKIQPRSYHEL